MNSKNFKYRDNRVAVNKVYILLFFVICFCTSILNAEGNSFQVPVFNAKEKGQLIYLAKQFRERIQANEYEIKTLINEKEWLENRVKRLEDLGRPVPWNVFNSIDLKQQKIQTAINENGRLGDLLKQQKYKAIEKHNTELNVYDLFESSRPNRFSKSSPGSTNDSLFHTTDFYLFKNNLAKKIKQSGLEEWVQFTPDENCCTLETVLPILFASGSVKIAKEYKDFFKRLAKLVKNYDVRIRINGYTDSDNINTKKYPSNFELGAGRAANIVHELVKNGVKASVFQIGTTGEYRPEAKGMSNKKLLERRAVLKIIFVSKGEMG